jgi:hypothetical protein
MGATPTDLLISALIVLTAVLLLAKIQGFFSSKVSPERKQKQLVAYLSITVIQFLIIFAGNWIFNRSFV